jgi:hypothetical protein
LLVSELRENGHARGRDFVEWAVRALDDGHDTQELRALAGLDLGGVPTALEGAERFRVALQELGVVAPPEEELLRAYVSEVAEQVAAGSIAPQDAVARLHREVLSPFGHPRDLMAWCFLWEGLHPLDYSSLDDDAALDAAIREQVRAWLDGTA